LWKYWQLKPPPTARFCFVNQGVKMRASNRLGVRVKPNDEQVLHKLAEHLDRSLSDTVRFAIKYTARRYGLLPKKKTSNVTKAKEGNTP
jgi:hypothetical protein